MADTERTSLIILLCLTALAYGFWAPGARLWLPWAATWALAMGIAALLIAYNHRRRRADRETSSPLSPIITHQQWAHEVRTPLMHIRLYLRQLRESVPDEAEDAVDQLETELERVSQLLESMALLSQPTPSQPGEILHLHHWIAEILPLYQEAAQTVGLRLEHTVSTAPPIRVRPDYLRHVMSNLLSNAFRYAEPGSTIQVAVAADGPLWAALTVSNRSAAPTRPVKELAQPFVRDPTAEVSGTGLGLSVVDRIARGAGGRMQVQYRDGMFSVRVLLPRTVVGP